VKSMCVLSIGMPTITVNCSDSGNECEVAGGSSCINVYNQYYKKYLRKIWPIVYGCKVWRCGRNGIKIPPPDWRDRFDDGPGACDMYVSDSRDWIRTIRISR
jgi:hypothetical protein